MCKNSYTLSFLRKSTEISLIIEISCAEQAEFFLLDIFFFICGIFAHIQGHAVMLNVVVEG